MGLRLRVILILTIPALLVVGVHGYLRIRQEDAQLRVEDQQNLAVTARAVQIAVENALRDRQISDVRRLLIEMVERQEIIDRIRLFDPEMRPTLVSNRLAIGDAVPALELGRVMRTGIGEGFFQRGKPSYLYYIVPVRGGTGAVEGALEIVQLAASVDRRLQAYTLDAFVRLSVLLVVLVVVTAAALQLQVLRPLARLTEGIQRLGRGEPGPALPVGRRDELGRVAEAFNEMSARLAIARERLMTETERAVEMERQLRRSATLAVAGKLTSALAHEVGTPLNIILGRAEFHLKNLAGDDPSRQDLETIIGQIDRISRIINSLLDTVRPQKPDLRPMSLTSVLEPLLPLLHHAARARDVTLQTSTGDAQVPELLADRGQVQQVLINLVLNGLEATPAGGRVEVSAARADRAGRPGAVISVRDTGPGIADDVLPKIFDPFFTTKPPGQGTGLGLSICRDIVRTHGGELAVESVAPHGATFTVWLPAARTPGS
jgi:two-component system NtrC family sensor kinase